MEGRGERERERERKRRRRREGVCVWVGFEGVCMMEMGRRCWVLGQSRLIANRNKEVREGKVKGAGGGGGGGFDGGRKDRKNKKQQV